MEPKNYKNKYLKYKNKYLEFKQYGGEENLNYIYFCFNREQVESTLKRLERITNYTPDVVDMFLILGAYKCSFNNELNLVKFNKLDKLTLNLNNSDNLPEKFYINRPINIIESTHSLMDFIKLLNDKINLVGEKKVEEKKVEEPEAEESKAEEKKGGGANIQICDVLIFCKNTNKHNRDNNYSLVRHYIVNNETMEEKKIGSESIKFIDIDKTQSKRRGFFN